LKAVEKALQSALSKKNYVTFFGGGSAFFLQARTGRRLWLPFDRHQELRKGKAVVGSDGLEPPTSCV
jgi:hypothetical protein